jgi:cytochrome c oxidase subunit 1
MPRRIYTYAPNMGWNLWNMVSTVGAFVIAGSTCIFIYNVAVDTRRRPKDAPADPWDARTLEWMIPSPAPAYNFAEIPVVHEVDDYWHRKYGEDASGRLVRVADAEDFIQQPLPEGAHVHMPSPSYFPLVAACGLPIICYGLIYRVWPLSIVGALVLLGGIYAWGLEPSVDPEVEAEEAEAEHALALVGAPAAGELGSGQGEPSASAGLGEGGSGEVP